MTANGPNGRLCVESHSKITFQLMGDKMEQRPAIAIDGRPRSWTRYSALSRLRVATWAELGQHCSPKIKKETRGHACSKTFILMLDSSFADVCHKGLGHSASDR